MTRPTRGGCVREDVQRGIAAVGEAGLVYDLLVRTRELPAAVETARRHPDMRFVLDHAAKPTDRRGRARPGLGRRDVPARRPAQRHLQAVGTGHRSRLDELDARSS